MMPDASHIKQIKVVCNTHWDRESRYSFEKNRRRLLSIMDTTLDILDEDPRYHSFTVDSQSILIDDYLEMRPERRPQMERLIQTGRLIISPWYTPPDQFSLGQESLVRSLLWGRKTMEKFGARLGSVVFTPVSSWLIGQLPQILLDFGLNKVMLSHDIAPKECAAEFIWMGADGSCVLCSRFAIYARSNWVCQACCPLVANGTVFEKDYRKGECNEAPMRAADKLSGKEPSFGLKSPDVNYDKSRLRETVERMVELEGPHFSSEVLLALHGNDNSAAHPLDPQMIQDAAELFRGKYAIEQTDLESHWAEVIQHLDIASIPILKGERRSSFHQGMWTFLYPGTINAQTFLEHQDFLATIRLVHEAEPLAVLANWLGADYPKSYLDRGWAYLMANHHANSSCASDAVRLDLQYRYRKVADVADIVAGDAMAYIAQNLCSAGHSAESVQLVAFNPLPFERETILEIDLEMPRELNTNALGLKDGTGEDVALQPVLRVESSSFANTIWDVPNVLDMHRIKAYAYLQRLPAFGYRTFQVVPLKEKIYPHTTLVTGPNSMENEHLKVSINVNGTVDLLVKATGKVYSQLNYLTCRGGSGDSLKHVSPLIGGIFSSLGGTASISAIESGPLVSIMAAEYELTVLQESEDGKNSNPEWISFPVRVEYRLECNLPELKVSIILGGSIQNYWVRVNFPSGLNVKESWADSHFDVVSRPVTPPDSASQIEKPEGTHPLRTFVALQDGRDIFAVMPLGLFEYEVFDDESCILALTLIRACQIKRDVSGENQREFSDSGMQCPSARRFQYAIHAGPGGWQSASLSNRSAQLFAPVHAVQTAHGKGTMPREASLFSLANPNLQVTCMKQAEDGNGLLIRLFNTLEESQTAEFRFGRPVHEAYLCKMDESVMGSLPIERNEVRFLVEPKKIRTFKFVVERPESSMGSEEM